MSKLSFPVGCGMLAILMLAVVVLSGTSKGFSFGDARRFAGDMADLVRQQQYTDHELAGAKTLAEAQQALDTGHAAVVTADAAQEEANNGKMLILALFLIGMFALAIKAKLG